ncbi:MAG: alpha/beta hydrolase [Chloroflexota bacterium]
MKKWKRIVIITIVVLALVASGMILNISADKAHEMVTNPLEERDPITRSPADYGIAFEEITLLTEDGLSLAAWYIPSQNGAAVIAVHGYKSNRESLLEETDMLHRHGYGVLLFDMRSHGESEGEILRFGVDELQDFEAAYQYLLTRVDVDPARIGLIGSSNGGAMSILYTAQNPEIKALVAHSAYVSLQDEIATGVEHFGGVPAFPFAPLIQFFAEREVDIRAKDIAPIAVIDQISPRPILILQGGADVAIPTDSGQRLYDEAEMPKELWFEPSVGHTDFDDDLPGDFEARIIAFFDKFLLGEAE